MIEGSVTLPETEYSSAVKLTLNIYTNGDTAVDINAICSSVDALSSSDLRLIADRMDELVKEHNDAS